jgi:hypothetical protein
MSITPETAREQARAADGRFGAQPNSAAEVTLPTGTQSEDVTSPEVLTARVWAGIIAHRDRQLTDEVLEQAVAAAEHPNADAQTARRAGTLAVTVERTHPEQSARLRAVGLRPSPPADAWATISAWEAADKAAARAGRPTVRAAND